VGPAALDFLFFCFMKNALPRAKWALGTAVPRVWALTHGRAAFAGPAVPGALCRELPLGTGCAESNQACAERIALSAQARIPVVIGRSSGIGSLHWIHRFLGSYMGSCISLSTDG
jgi:hypothetical protein